MNGHNAVNGHSSLSIAFVREDLQFPISRSARLFA